MLNSITLLGSSSGRNAGDAALMSGIMDSVDQACGARLRYDIPTIKPGFVRGNYKNDVRPVGMMPWDLSLKMLGLPTYSSIMRTDLSLVFDAPLFDRSLYNPLFNFLWTLHQFLPRARRKGKLVGCYNVGTGPVSLAAGRRKLRELLECMDFITVRDQGSYDLLRDIGVKNPRVLLTADAALNCYACPDARAREILAAKGVSDPSAALAININQYIDTWAGHGKESMGRERFLQIYAEALNRVGEQTGAPLVYVCTQHHDVDITRDLMSRVKKARSQALVTNVEYSHYEVKGVLAQVGMLYAMRLHALILASAGHTPVAGIAYQPKCRFYLDVLGIPERILGFEDYTPDSLSAHILEAWRNRKAIRAQLDSVIPGLQAKANRPAQLIADLRAGQSIDQAWNRAVAAG